MELYTYMHTGGEVERIVLMDIEGKTPEQLRNTLARFDALKASCFKTTDREKLLGVIEAGYGDLRAFNMEVRSLLGPVAPPSRIARNATMPGRIGSGARAAAGRCGETAPREEALPEEGRILAAQGVKRGQSAHL